MKKWIFIIIGILIVGFIGYRWIGSNSTSQQQALASQIRTATVQKGKMQVYVSGSGTIQPVTSEDIIAPANNNSIDSVLVSTNEHVTKGEDLVTFTDGSDPITAPTDGTITTVSVAPGERVNAGQAVAHLTNYSNLDTTISVDELDIPKVRVGQTVSVSVSAYPNQTYTGTVSAIANEGTSTNGVSTFNVTVKLSNVQNLKVGMSTEASILTASKANALYLPIEAVHSRGTQKFVILASSNSDQNSDQNSNQNRFGSMQAVETGLTNDNYVEITKGLSEGQTVRLPQLAVNSTTTANGKGGFMMGGFGSGAMRTGGYGGMRNGGQGSARNSSSQGGGQGGRSGN